MRKLLSSLGQVSAVIGAQWGDEGKGKIVDILAEQYDVIARACGGANAGHTIVVDGKKHVFHLLPSGCMHERKDIVLGSGMVIHLPTLLEEISTLKNVGIDVLPWLHISREAHILFEYHKDIDASLEERRSKNEGQGIGTTKRGIGPAYTEKAARSGVRMESLGKNLESELKMRSEFVKEAYGVSIDIAKEISSLDAAFQLIGSCIEDTVSYLHEAWSREKTILVEGAQATLLDIDHGTYPYVTSSSTTLAGALQGLGLPPKSVKSCIGVAKAYCTRVGGGDFPAEAEEKAGDRLRKRGGEYGSTTGRPRRTGWLCIDDLRFAANINGFTHWNLTKLDVLDEEKGIPVLVEGKWKTFPGWCESTVGITDRKKLPEKAEEYIRFIEEETHLPASFIGTGQEREAMIIQI